MIQGNDPKPGEANEQNRSDIFSKDGDRLELMSSVKSGSGSRAEDTASSEDQPITKEDLTVLVRDISAIGHRLEQIEEDYYKRVPIPLPTPTDGIEETKSKLTQLINYINIGVRRG